MPCLQHYYFFHILEIKMVVPEAHARKAAAEAIFKPVDHARRYLLAVQWRKADQPTPMA